MIHLLDGLLVTNKRGQKHNMLENIKICIRENIVIEVQYNEKIRIIEPHAVGESKTGSVLIRAYQRKSEDAAEGWRLFDIEKIQSILILEEKFDLRLNEGYKKTDNHFTKLYEFA